MRNIKKIIILITDTDHMRLYYANKDEVHEIEHKKYEHVPGGTKGGWAQKQFMDHHDEIEEKRVKEEIDKVEKELKKHQEIDEIIIAGTKIYINHLYNEMPKELQQITKKVPAEHQININNLIEKAHELN